MFSKEQKLFTPVKRILFTAAIVSSAFVSQAQNEITIRLDTKMMGNFDCNLNGNGVDPAPVDKVYMHSGACSENRGLDQNQSAFDYCANQILPFASDVWQHVVGNWGANPQDDGIGEMTHTGDGVYEFTYIPEQYYSDASIVSTEQNSTGTTVSSPLVSGNTIHMIGMVFRNEDGQVSGRDEEFCNDIFVINLNTENPSFVNSDFVVQDFLTLDKPNGIENSSVVGNFRFGPNPITDNAIFQLYLREKRENVTFEIHSTVGQLVFSDALNLNAGKNSYNLNTTAFSSGIYLTTFKDATGILVQERIVVQ